ncbi:MAG: cyclase family protein [Cyclobacteriaceae bacterium]|nr:cyclase family protein [Cyclobacteriaceae bacterium]
MIVQLTAHQKKYSANLAEPLDISLPLREGNNNPNCYWAEPVKFETIESGDFIGSVARGGSVNYQKVTLTPHGNGTHTECSGHISSANVTINQALNHYHFLAELISVEPVKTSTGDFIITREAISQKMLHEADALIIRTLPNPSDKHLRQYSGTNPPYLTEEAAAFIAARDVQHLVLDLPSVDKEKDEGRLAAHKAFWMFPDSTRTGCTITELAFIDNAIPDGLYLLNLHVISLEIDACPSKPVLYKLTEVS